MKNRNNLKILIRFILIFIGLFHFALPIWMDVILSLSLVLYFKKIINSFVFLITCLIFSFSINYLWGDYKLEEVYYRPHEKYTKNNNYKKNISDTMYMPYGDLYALGNEPLAWSTPPRQKSNQGEKY